MASLIINKSSMLLRCCVNTSFWLRPVIVASLTQQLCKLFQHKYVRTLYLGSQR